MIIDSSAVRLLTISSIAFKRSSTVDVTVVLTNESGTRCGCTWISVCDLNSSGCDREIISATIRQGTIGATMIHLPFHRMRRMSSMVYLRPGSMGSLVSVRG